MGRGIHEEVRDGSVDTLGKRGEVLNGSGVPLEVRDESMDPRGGQGQVGDPRGGPGRVGRPSGKSGRGRGTLEAVRDGSGEN